MGWQKEKTEGLSTLKITAERIDSRPEIELMVWGKDSLSYYDENTKVENSLSWAILKCLIFEIQKEKGGWFISSDLGFAIYKELGIFWGSKKLQKVIGYYRFERSYITNVQRHGILNPCDFRYKMTQRGRRALK